MRYTSTPGALVTYEDFDLSLGIEVSYAGLWRSLNDRVHYVTMVDGFGVIEQTHRRKTVSSDFYAGDYTVRAVPESVKRTWKVLVQGSNQTDLESAVWDDLVPWFRQDVYNVRVMKNEVVETYQCEKADYAIDQSHVYLHNCRAVVSLTFSSRPTVSREILL